MCGWQHTCKTIPPSSWEAVHCGTDHAPVLIGYQRRTATSASKRQTVHKWRLENLHKADVRDAYAAEISKQRSTWKEMLDALESSTADSAQEVVNQVSTAFVHILKHAASTSIGNRTIVYGITKRWMTPAARQAIAARRRAYAARKVNPALPTSKHFKELTQRQRQR